MASSTTDAAAAKVDVASSSPGVTQTQSIEDQRAKAVCEFRESLVPGVDIIMDLKKMLYSAVSEYQQVDVIETTYGKTLITDGKTQSSQFDERVYHESLVHPSLLLVAPRTVFIGGGGELATAREVLKHKSVERVVMVDLDQVVIEVCKQYLPEWGGEAVASHPKLELIVGDAYQYLMETKETFDVIIMDISDPIEAGPGVMLYTKEFYEHASTLLQPNGIFVTQAGMAEPVPTASFLHTDPSCIAPIYNTLDSVFPSVKIYSTYIPSFGSDWGFIMASKQPIPQRDIQQIDTLIEEGIDGGEHALIHYDGVSHQRMIHLTKLLRNQMKRDSRIMTRENPIYMY